MSHAHTGGHDHPDDHAGHRHPAGGHVAHRLHQGVVVGHQEAAEHRRLVGLGALARGQLQRQRRRAEVIGGAAAG